MKILKNILIGFGVLFVLFIFLAVFLFSKSSEFFEQHQPFVEEFAYDFAENWRVDDVHSRVSNEFLQSLDTPNGKAFLAQASAFGRLVDATDFQMGNYHSGTGGNVGAISFKATFTNTKALVTVSVIEKDGKVRIQGFNVSATDGLSAPITREQEANHGMNTEAKQLVSLKVFGAFTVLAFVNSSGMFGPGYAER